MTRLMKLLSRYITCLLTLFILASCSDEIEPVCDYTVTGKDVTVKVRINTPVTDVKSRAPLSDYQIDEVRTLWIRTYSASTGAATCDWIKIEEIKDDLPTHDTEEKRYVDIATKSGSTYVIAVANVDNPGVTKSAPTESKPLRELLESADTWPEFLDIAALTPSATADINTAPLPVTMSGCLSNVPVGGTHPSNLAVWGSTNYNFAPVFVPATSSGTYTMGGAIHLRRLVSHVTFKIKAGKDVTIRPSSYTVFNVPKATWLYERTGIDGYNDNFGGTCTRETAGDYFANSSQFTSQYISEDNGVFAFDFWQGENKHKSLPDGELAHLGIAFGDDQEKNYQYRELEVKNENGANSGIYKCLSGEEWTPENMATFVTFRADIEYKDKFKSDIDGTVRDVTRIGNAVFTVHLGYLDKDAADFNCYRNTDYTYTVTVNGLNNVMVEAEKNDEPQPGVEGLVSDVENATIFLDCHYSSFNIQLSKDELKYNKPDNRPDVQGIGFVITAWDNGREYTFTEDSEISADEMKYIDWVELRPTTGPNVLSKYYPRDHKTEGNKTFTLADAAKAKTWDDNDPRFSTSGYYTVFVNEYTYETSADERCISGDPNWARYVNQNSRQFFIRVTKEVSDDGESVYARSKYAGSQASIQTYYSTSNFTEAQNGLPNGTAIGMEHINEMLGMNLFSSWRPSGMSDQNFRKTTNGRNNTWLWINSKGTDWSNFFNANDTDKDYWNQQWIPAVATASLQNGPEIPGGYMLLPSLKPSPSAYRDNEYKGNYSSTPGASIGGALLYRNNYDPQPRSTNKDYYFEAISACMNRNRDNNGNGKIDADELRWFVPTSRMYLRLILGDYSLSNPIMDFESLKDKTIDPVNGYNTRYLYYTSNGYIVWAVEGMSLSDDNKPYAFTPWQIRCVRNLGSNLSTVTEGNKVEVAYEHDAVKRIVKMTYYDPASVRSISYTGNGSGTSSETDKMPVHMVTSQYNLPYKAFQYTTTAPTTDRIPSDYSFNNWLTLIQNNPCSSLNNATNGYGWRVPNQKELTILYNLGVFTPTGTGSSYLTSCTVSYFNTTGKGGDMTNNKFMGVRGDASCQLDFNAYPAIRCVRDYVE